MAKVEFLGPIGKAPIEVEITTLRELRGCFDNDPQVKEWIEKSAIAVNDRLVNDLDHPIAPNDKISLLPPVCGG